MVEKLVLVRGWDRADGADGTNGTHMANETDEPYGTNAPNAYSSDGNVSGRFQLLHLLTMMPL